MLARLVDVVRSRGLRAAARWALYRTAKKLMTLDVTHLMWLDAERATPPPARDDGMVYRFLSADDVRRFAVDPRCGLDASLAERLEGDRDFCFAAVSGERLAAYGWYALGSVESRHNRGSTLNSGLGLEFPPYAAFMYKGFTHPDFRGRGLYGRVNAGALSAMAAHGVTALLSSADWTNWSALGSCWRLGYEDLGTVWRAGWGRYMLTRFPPAGKKRGVQYGRRANIVDRRTLKALHLERADGAVEFEPEIEALLTMAESRQSRLPAHSTAVE